jgi:hypothetical protein
MRKMGLFWFAAALLGAALIFAGCETEADEKIVYLQGEMIHLDVVVSDVTALKGALALTGDLAIGFDGSTTNTLTEALEVEAGKVIYILSGGTLKTASGFDLTVKGIVYVGIGGILDTSAGEVKVVDNGIIYVLSGKTVTGGVNPGTLVIKNAGSVNYGAETGAATVLGTDKGKVLIGGTLKLDNATATVSDITAAFGYINSVNLDAGTNTELTPTAAVGITIPTGKTLTIQADKADTTTSIVIPARLFLKTSQTFASLATVTVTAGGGFSATPASGTDSAFPAAGIVLVAEGDFYAKNTVLFNDDSSVGANGSVALGAGATFTTGKKLTVANGSLVYFGATNNVWFPAAAGITGISATELTIDGIDVPEGEVLAVEGGTLVLAAEAVLTLNKGAAIWGAVKAGATTISGGGPPDTGGWRASDDVATVITAGGSGAATTATIAGGELSGFNGSVITQAAESGNNLTIGANTTIALEGTDTPGGIIKLTQAASNPGKLTLADATSVIYTLAAKTEGANYSALTGITGFTKGTGITVTEVFQDSNKLTKLIGASSDATLTASTSGTDTNDIDSTTATTGT